MFGSLQQVIPDLLFSDLKSTINFLFYFWINCWCEILCLVMPINAWESYLLASNLQKIKSWLFTFHYSFSIIFPFYFSTLDSGFTGLFSTVYCLFSFYYSLTQRSVIQRTTKKIIMTNQPSGTIVFTFQKLSSFMFWIYHRILKVYLSGKLIFGHLLLGKQSLGKLFSILNRWR